jgi:hypothetical protein
VLISASTRRRDRAQRIAGMSFADLEVYDV